MYTVDIDTGGTMTDALVSDGKQFFPFKTDTTPHDYTISFFNCLEEASKILGYDHVDIFLRDVSIIRWSSTITTNILAERSGAKVGILVTKGYEKNLYGKKNSLVTDEYVPKKNIIGLSNEASNIEIMGAVKKLLEEGVRRICVCLKDSFPDNSNEKKIKAVIEEQYPDHIIGSIPVLLGSEMAQLAHDQTRVHYALINAYTHTQLANSLFKAEDVLKYGHQWDGPLLIGNTSGGVAKIGKTKSVDTIESGPVFGTFGGAHIARHYSLSSVLCFDVGGTTTKASIVQDGKPVTQRGGDLMGVPVKTTFAMLRSAAVGGGSIANINKNGLVRLGPKSMGSAPGPACYGLGGSKPTLTDALLLLGYIDGNNFLGGRRQLDVEKSISVIEKHISNKLNISVKEAAIIIRDEAVSMMVELIQSILHEANIEASDTPLFAFGGNGPMFASLIAEKLGLPSAYVFNLGPVFSAFGSAMSDVIHVYERGLGVGLNDTNNSNLLSEVASQLYGQASRDLKGEGFDANQAKFGIEIEYSGDVGDTGSFHMPWPEKNKDIFEHIQNQFAHTHEQNQSKKIELQLFRLHVSYSISEKIIPKSNKNYKSDLQSVSRELIFNKSDLKDAKGTVYQWESLVSGDVVHGSSVVCGETMTCPILSGWELIIDDYQNGKLQRSKIKD
jgi:N-methylhydantoinase A/oxoprolinase/acetone carboxylase beta subunit